MLSSGSLLGAFTGNSGNSGKVKETQPAEETGKVKGEPNPNSQKPAKEPKTSGTETTSGSTPPASEPASAPPPASSVSATLTSQPIAPEPSTEVALAEVASEEVTAQEDPLKSLRAALEVVTEVAENMNDPRIEMLFSQPEAADETAEGEDTSAQSQAAEEGYAVTRAQDPEASSGTEAASEERVDITI